MCIEHNHQVHAHGTKLRVDSRERFEIYSFKLLFLFANASAAELKQSKLRSCCFKFFPTRSSARAQPHSRPFECERSSFASPSVFSGGPGLGSPREAAIGKKETCRLLPS